MLLVGAGALASGMARSAVTSNAESQERWVTVSGLTGSRSHDEASVVIVGFSACIGLGCGIVLAVIRRIGFFRLLASAWIGGVLGGLAGFQVISHGNLLMTVLGAMALMAFGGVIHRTAESNQRTDAELAWLSGAESSQSAPANGPIDTASVPPGPGAAAP
jgi:hypothetical protein